MPVYRSYPSLKKSARIRITVVSIFEIFPKKFVCPDSHFTSTLTHNPPPHHENLNLPLSPQSPRLLPSKKSPTKRTAPRPLPRLNPVDRGNTASSNQIHARQTPPLVKFARRGAHPRKEKKRSHIGHSQAYTNDDAFGYAKYCGAFRV